MQQFCETVPSRCSRAFLKRFAALFLSMSMLVSSSAGYYTFAEPVEDGTASEHSRFSSEEYAGAPAQPIDADAKTPEGGGTTGQFVTVSKFDIEIIDGYSRRDGDGTYVWNANTSADGHPFIFNILFQTSGNDIIPEGAIEITIPASILKDKTGQSADVFEMSVPYIDEVTEELKSLHSWAYKVNENGDLVITNIQPITAGQAYHFNVGYSTSEETFYYEDMKDFQMWAGLDFTIDGTTEHRDSSILDVAIDTDVKITNTAKKKPMSLLTEWDNAWGEKPSDADNYDYLIWEIESVVDEKATQFYDFSLDDYEFRCTAPEKYAEMSAQLEVVGYNFSGSGNAYVYAKPAVVEDQEKFGVRHDFVLTRIPKEWYRELGEDERIELENNVEATVHPVDHDADRDQADTSAAAQQTYVLERPKFSAPISQFFMGKKGGSRNYQLDDFANGKNPASLNPYPYSISAGGYTFEKTYEKKHQPASGADPTLDYRNYGHKKLHFELTDDTVSLRGYVGDNEKTAPPYDFGKKDYYFTEVRFNWDILMVKKEADGLAFDDETKSFVLTAPDAASGYEVSFALWGEFYDAQTQEQTYRKIATIPYNGTQIQYEPGMEKIAAIGKTSNSGFTVTFLDDSCTGYRLVTSDDIYYSVSLNAEPSIQLKNSDALREWINGGEGKRYEEHNKEKVTELRLTNTAAVDCFVGDETVFHGADSAVDYQNGSTRRSSISKIITSAKNNPLYKRYEITWKIDAYEYVITSANSANNAPVIQYGGEFFDLLPTGSSIDLSTVQVMRENSEPIDFNARTLPGENNRVLLHVTIPKEQPGEKYTVCFTSYHSWEDIAAFGSDILNPAAYVTGNDDLADTGNGARGRYKNNSMQLMVESINSTREDGDKIIQDSNGNYSLDGTFGRTIFNYEPFDIKAVVMTNVGVHKSVKNATEGTYTAKTVIDDENRGYSYRLRLENAANSRSINNVLIDFLEYFTGDNPTVKSAWKGTLRSVDVSQILGKYAKVRLYYSTEHYFLDESLVYYHDEADHDVYLVGGAGEKTSGADNVMVQGIRNFLPEPTKENPRDNNYWTLVDESLCGANGVYDLTSVIEALGSDRHITAIAVDFTYADEEHFTGDEIENIEKTEGEELNKNARMTEDGKFILGLGEAAYVILNMDNADAPPPPTKDSFRAEYEKQYETGYAEADFEQAYRDCLNGYNAYNDVFSASSVFNRSQTSDNAAEAWLEQNYTTVSYRIRSDFYAQKRNAEKMSETISGIVFNLSGTSVYGTKINQNIVTTGSGLLVLEDLEVGEYVLTEVDCGRDWLIDRTEYRVTVNPDKTVTVTPDLNFYQPEDDTSQSRDPDHGSAANPFVLVNTPRAHADIEFDKNLYGKSMTNLGIAGVTFKLSGISYYNNEIIKIAVSDFGGRVYFEDVERGEYQLQEVDAPDGYARSNIIYTVRVDENGNWQITASDPNALLQGDNSVGYTVGNEKYQEFFLQKTSTEAVGKNGDQYLLNGAEFRLYGTTDDGKTVDMTAVSGTSAKYGNGVVHFNNLEHGTYILMETQTPVITYTDENGKTVTQEFYPDNTHYTVIVNENGIKITDANGKELSLAPDKNGKPIAEDFFTFTNTPVSGAVVVRKVWVDGLTADERNEKLGSKLPNIVVSKEKPDPFTNEYAIFSYNGNNINDSSRLYRDILFPNKGKIVSFQRYSAKITIPEGEPDTIGITLSDGTAGTAYRVSMPAPTSPKPIYAWFDNGAVYWYTAAMGAKFTTTIYLFDGQTALKTANLSGIDLTESASFSNMFHSCTALVDVTGLTRSATENTTISAAYMFNNCTNLASSGKLDLSDFETEGITNMQYMFAQSFKSGSPVLDWGSALNTKDVQTFGYMFDTCSNLTAILATEINAESVNQSNGFVFMFGNSSALRIIPALVRSADATGTGISADKMFYQCKNLGRGMKEIDLSNFHTQGITNMYQMFQNAFKYSDETKTGVINWGTALKTENVTTFHKMFNSCSSLLRIDAAEMNFDGVTAADGMEWVFGDSQALVSIPTLTRKKNSADANTGLSMQQMFYQCFVLQKIDFSDFNTAGVTNMSYLFSNCKAIQELDLKKFDTSNVTTMQHMFAQCINLKTLDLLHFQTSKVKTMSNMFDNCAMLTELDLSSFTQESLTSANTMFCNCSKLTVIYAKPDFDLSNIAKDSGNMFQKDDNLLTRQGVAADHNPDHGSHAYVAGTKTDSKYVGYFTDIADKPQSAERPAPVSNLRKAYNAGRTVSLNAKTARKLYVSLNGDGIAAVADAPETTQPGSAAAQSDDDNYRSSANHKNANGNTGGCDELHFFLVRSKEDIAAIQALVENGSLSQEEYDKIYELVKDFKDDEWVYVFTDLVGVENFHIWEENVPKGYESDFDNCLDENDQQRVTSMEGGAATITNRLIKLKTGKLTICKRVTDMVTHNDVTDEVTDKFQFRIQLSNMPEDAVKSVTAYYYKVPAGGTADKEGDDWKNKITLIFYNGTATIDIQSGYTLELIDLPEGTEYTITETQSEEIVSTAITVTEKGEASTDCEITLPEKKVSGKIKADLAIEAEYNNTIDADTRTTGAFYLRKLVENENDAADPNAEYQFLIEFTNLKKNTEYSIYNTKDDSVIKTFTSNADKTGLVTVSVKAGETLSFKDIPEGATYRITEYGSSAYISSYVVTDAAENELDSNANTSAGSELAASERTMNPKAPEVTTTYTNRIVKVQKIALTKQVLGEEKTEQEPPENPEDETVTKYKFVAVFSNLGANYSLTVQGLGTLQADENGTLEAEFYLLSGDRIVFTNVPVGAEYSFYEDYDGTLIPCAGVFVTDEDSGETENRTPSPSLNSGADIAEAVTAAEKDVEKAKAAVDQAKAEYEPVEHVFRLDKDALDAVIQGIMNQLTDIDDASSAAFTAEGYVNDNDAYFAARETILGKLGAEQRQTEEANLLEAEGNLKTALPPLRQKEQALRDAEAELAAAKATLEKAKSASGVAGKVEQNKDVEIIYSNGEPFDLKISKEVTGEFADLLLRFRFKVEFRYHGIPFIGTFTAEKNGAVIMNNTYTETLDAPYAFENGAVYFELGNGDTITFKDLPSGTTYEIVEAKVRSYDVYIDGKLTENRTATGKITSDTEIAYRNTWNGPIAELPGAGAGISKRMIYLAGIVMLAEGLVGAVLIYRRKRRQRCI